MRIVLTSLDGIGDVMLRQPLFAALAREGHELLIVCRQFTAGLVQQMVPEARVVIVGCDPYKMTQARDSGFPEEVLETIKAFFPELLVVAPFQWTIFEDYLASRLPHVATLGLSGYAYEADARPRNDPLPAFSPQRRVEVPEETPELRKNELLCQAILGTAATLPLPRLVATTTQLQRAAEFLRRNAISEGTPWICCVGHSDNYYSQLKAWSRNDWITALGQMAAKHAVPLVFVGSLEDRDSLMWIRERLGGAGVPMAVAADLWGDLDLLIGLSAISCGYIGHDTGPMHLAAALGKPVLGLFGGGGGLRFLPAAEPSCVITMKVPCQGCGWFCHMEESFCIKKIPVADVVRAVDDLITGQIKGRDLRMIESGPKILAEMVKRGVEVERKKRYALREYFQSASSAVRHSKNRQEELASAQRALAEREVSMKTLQEEQERETARYDEANMRVGQLRRELAAMTESIAARERDSEVEQKKLKHQLAGLQAELRDVQYQRSKIAGDLANTQREHRSLLEALEQMTQRNADLTSEGQALREQVNQLTRERDEHAARARELSHARSRRLLTKLNLVSRCPWETD